MKLVLPRSWTAFILSNRTTLPKEKVILVLMFPKSEFTELT